MELFNPKYVDALDQLIDELRETPPLRLAFRVYASMHAIVEGAKSDIDAKLDIPGHTKEYPKGQLNGILLHSRQAAVLENGTREEELKRAEECVNKIRAVF